MKKLISITIIFLIVLHITSYCNSMPLTVAIIGSGIDIYDTTLQPYLWVNQKEIPWNGLDDDNNGYIDDVYGWNFVDNTNIVGNEKDDNSHETAVFKDLLNEILWKWKKNKKFNVMCIKVFETNQAGCNSTINKGVNDIALYEDIVDYVVNNGAKIVSLSLTFDVDNPIEIEKLIKKYPNVLFVQSAGNDSKTFYENLRNVTNNEYDNRIIVGALNGTQNIAKYSNYGEGVDVYADGRYFYKVTEDKFWRMMEGTSFAVPKIVARCINLFNTHPDATPKQIKEYIKEGKY